MTQQGETLQQAGEQVKQASRRAAQQPWVEKLARFGLVAKGVVYVIVGVLAVLAATGQGGETTSTQGALTTIAQQPFGQVLLGLVAIGLIGYALWRVVQATMDTENKGNEPKGLANRAGYIISGISYVGLALAAIRIVMGSGSSGSSTSSMTGQLMSVPFGRWLVAIVGAVVIGVGVYELYRAYKASFRKHLKLNEMSATEETWATRSGRIGLAAHGIVFGMVGLFLVQAAIASDPNQAQGIDGALQTLAQQPYGPWLLGIVALGLVAYGLYQFVEARYRRMVVQ